MAGAAPNILGAGEATIRQLWPLPDKIRDQNPISIYLVDISSSNVRHLFLIMAYISNGPCIFPMLSNMMTTESRAESSFYV